MCMVSIQFSHPVQEIALVPIFCDIVAVKNVSFTCDNQYSTILIFSSVILFQIKGSMCPVQVSLWYAVCENSRNVQKVTSGFHSVRLSHLS